MDGAGEIMYVIVVGCGRLGSRLATELSDFGHDVCVIDRSGSRLDVLGSGFNGQRIQGIEFDSDNLTEGGIRQADALLAVSSDDNINITVCLIAERIYHVPEIIARINDPARQYIYEKLNISTINPVELGVEILKNRLDAKNVDTIADLGDGCKIIAFTVGKKDGYTVEELQEKYACTVSGLIRDKTVQIPQKGEPVLCGDRIVCTIYREEEEKLLKALSKEVPIWNQSL
ncbi:potassium channel family protein [Caproiciproducens faecalis]|uniref:TrkA family potassium uptake protein n=1 Tax=Caproiciproducens faecalis TaxID=2820301 RepID=A0ABS7DTE6_9FIRM|nr:TrkA family potassium uptake protein [Caproiciproducens faecalis]MBW7573856.1 TrkA family potassium uptake protein [Caproiciproducens faecalis]